MALGFIGDLLGLNQAKSARQSSAAQNAIAKQQLAMMQQAEPYYGALLQWAAQNAGLRLPQTPGIAGPVSAPSAQPKPGFGSSMDRLAAMRAGGQGTASIQPVGGRPQIGGLLQGGQPAAGLPNSALGIYGSNPADVYRMQQAEEEVNRLANQRGQMLQYRLGQQGIGNSATAGAALARNEQDALTQLANFRRQLAINAPMEQERRMQQVFQLLGLGQGAGGQAASIYGQQAGLQQQQAQGQQQMLMQLLPFLF